MNTYVIIGWDLPYKSGSITKSILQSFCLNVVEDDEINWTTLCSFASISASPIFICDERKVLILGEVIACWDSDACKDDFKDITPFKPLIEKINTYYETLHLEQFITDEPSIIVGCFHPMNNDSDL